MTYIFTNKVFGQIGISGGEYNSIPKEEKALFEINTETWNTNEIDKLLKDIDELDGDQVLQYQVEGCHLGIEIMGSTSKIVMVKNFIKYDWAGTEMIGIESDVAVLNNLTSWNWTEEKVQDIINGIEDAKSNETKYEWSTEDIHIVSNSKGVFLFDLMTRRAAEPGNGKYDLITKLKGYTQKDVADALQKIKKLKGTIKTHVTSDRAADFINCWNEMGIAPSLGRHIEQKLKLTWHHLDDLDSTLKGSFQLVHAKIHKQTTQHMGTYFLIDRLLKLIK